MYIYIYIYTYVYALMTSECRDAEISAQMPDSLALGAAGGSASTFLWGILRYLATEEVLPPIPDCICPDCPLDFDLVIRQQPAIYCFLAGLLCGVLLGPFVDLVWIIRERWRRFVLVRLGVASFSPANKGTYRVLS